MVVPLAVSAIARMFLTAAGARKRSSAAVLSAFVLFAGAARAQPVAESEPKQAPNAVEQAIRHYERGIQFYESDAYEAALLEFQTAYELAPHFRVLYNVAQVCFQLKDYVCALRNFEKYLLEGNEQLPAERRAEVEKEISTLRAFVARVVVETNVPGTTISVDDVVVGTTPLQDAVLVAAGRRKISASKDGLLPTTRIVDAPSGSVVNVSFELRPLTQERAAKAPPQAIEPLTPQSSEGEQEKSRFTTWSWVGIGAAGVLGVAGAVTGALALEKDSEYKQSLHTNNGAGDGERDAAQRLALTSDLLIGASIAALGTTLIITLTAESRPAKRLAFSFSPHSITVKGGF